MQWSTIIWGLYIVHNSNKIRYGVDSSILKGIIPVPNIPTTHGPKPRLERPNQDISKTI
jgi:hypothetical protein